MRTRTFLPRPEYPRPDRQRAFVAGVDWLNLNGAWEFRFDPERSGKENGWHLPGAERWPDQIIVPFCWESLGAWGEADAAGNDNYYSTRVYRNPLEVTQFNYRRAARHEVGWYRRMIRIPRNDHWRGRRVILNVGAAGLPEADARFDEANATPPNKGIPYDLYAQGAKLSRSSFPIGQQR